MNLLAEALAAMDENKRKIHELQYENAFYTEIIMTLRVKNDADIADASIRHQMHAALDELEAHFTQTPTWKDARLRRERRNGR